MRIILRVSLIAAITAPALAWAEGVPASPPGDPPSTLALGPLIDDVLRSNRDVAAYQAEERAAGERAVAAGAFPAPMVGFAIRSLPVPSFSFTQDEMTMKEVMLKQRLPWFGKRELRREAEGKVAEATGSVADGTRLALAEATADAYAGLWFSLASREVIESRAADLKRLAALARARLSSGGERQADVLRAEMEVARIQVPILELEEEETRQRAFLAALLSRDEPLAGAPELPGDGALPSEAELLATIDSHPDLVVLSKQEERAKLEARLASREKWPDPEVGVAYGFRTGLPDMVGAEVSIALPIFASSDQDRRAAAATAAARAAADRREARKANLVAEARAALAALRAQASRLAVYEDEILPRAKLTVRSATGAFQSGGVDFLTVLDAQVQRHAEELEALRARAELLRARARLARATGSLSILLSSGASNE